MSTPSTSGRLVLLASVSVLLSGCSAVRVKLGQRILLANTPVASMQVTQYKHPGIGPGERSSLIATLTQPGGTVLTSEGKGHGKVLWKDIAVTASVVSVNSKGVLSLPPDPRLSDGKTGHVALTLPSHPGVQAQLDIPLRYNYAFSASFSGSSGSAGSSGTDGTDGFSGLSGSMDPNNPSAGGDGGDGGNGGNGGAGSDGGDGPPVQVQLTVQPGPTPLLEASVSAPGVKTSFFLVDPQGGSLTVTSAGGSGGDGGKGGRAGRGGSGGIGMPNGSNGRDGTAGSDGGKGRDGNGGAITVFYDPAAQPYLAALHLNHPGGPAPVLQQKTIAPLW